MRCDGVVCGESANPFLRERSYGRTLVAEGAGYSLLPGLELGE